MVWGFLHGDQKGLFEFRFDLPARCAEALEKAEADIGLVPCAELDRLGLDFLPEVGIASSGDVRSILLISKTPLRQIRTLAADSSSRTSVALARILLAECHGVTPIISSQRPDLEAMLEHYDAALIIGDPALRLEPETLAYRVIDLGGEWTRWCGLPMVFAVWAGRGAVLTADVAKAFSRSCCFGRGRIGEIAREAKRSRGFPETVATDYLTRHIEYELTPRHLQGLELFRERVRTLEIVSTIV